MKAQLDPTCVQGVKLLLSSEQWVFYVIEVKLSVLCHCLLKFKFCGFKSVQINLTPSRSFTDRNIRWIVEKRAVSQTS